MHLEPFVQSLREQLLLAAENSGEDSRIVAERMAATIDAALRLTLLEVLSAAADEITLELAPGSVEVRLRGSDPEFALTIPGLDPPQAQPDLDDSGTARITLRLSDALKHRIEQAAAREGQSVNAWLVRTLGAATEAARSPHVPASGNTFTGWVH